MPRQEPMFDDAGGIPAWQPGRNDDPTAKATFLTDAEQLRTGDHLAVMGRIEKIVSIAKDDNGNLRISTSRTGGRRGYFRFPRDKVRIVPRDGGTPWQG